MVYQKGNIFTSLSLGNEIRLCNWSVLTRKGLRHWPLTKPCLILSQDSFFIVTLYLYSVDVSFWFPYGQFSLKNVIKSLWSLQLFVVRFKPGVLETIIHPDSPLSIYLSLFISLMFKILVYYFMKSTFKRIGFVEDVHEKLGAFSCYVVRAHNQLYKNYLYFFTFSICLQLWITAKSPASM